MIAQQPVEFHPLPRPLGEDVFHCLEPRGKRETWKWVCEHVRTKDGLPFSPIDYPWGEGIANAWDDPHVKTITLMTCARIGKTTIANALMMAAINHDPRPAMVGSSTETLLKEQIKDKYLPMMDLCEPYEGWLLPEHRRLQTRIDLKHSIVYGAWAGSATTLADKDPVYLHGGEVDKWTKNKSDEADPLFLFLERGAEQLDRKVMLESTPSTQGSSRIDNLFHNGTARRLHVPCPHCRHHQVFKLAKGRKGTGLQFDKDEEGLATPSIAYQTARYICEKCKKDIHDDQRMTMVRNGIWVPKGQTVTKTGKIRGKAVNETPDESFQLNRIYSPTFTFGDVAKEYASCVGDIDRYRNFINSWMGEVWVPRRTKATWEEVSGRMTGQHPRGVIHDSCTLVTMGIDVQIDHWVWMAIGWNDLQAGYLIDYGICVSWPEVSSIIRKPWQHADGGSPLVSQMTLIDARDGNRTDEVYAFCKSQNLASGPWVWACMGHRTDQMGQRPFRRQKITDKGRQTHRNVGLEEVEVVQVNTNYYQIWMQNCLERREAGQPNSLCSPIESATDEDLFRQLLNEMPESKEDTFGYDKQNFVRISKSIPIDLRDAARYARCGADVFLNNNWDRVLPRRVKPKAEPTPSEPEVIKGGKYLDATEQQPKEDRRSKWLKKKARNRFIRR